MPYATPHEPDGFEGACRRAHDALRRGIVDAYGSLSADPTNPQDAARRFGLNKNLTWKIWKLVDTDNPFEALKHLPGRSGVDIFVRGLAQAGADADALARVRDACNLFDQAVQHHIGDRPSLELVLDGLVAGHHSRLELSRKLAYRGFSGVLGVQAKAKLTVGMLAPNLAQPDRIDVTMIGGLLAFRRLRPGVEWPLFRIRTYSAVDPDAIKPDLRARLGPTWTLMRRFCSDHMPELRHCQTNEGLDLVLPAGPVGNTGALDCVFGCYLAALGDRYRSQTEKHGDVFSAITMPVERVIFDMLFHRDILPSAPPRVMVLGKPLNGPPPEQELAHQVLPIDARVRSLGSARSVRMANYPRYPDLIAEVCSMIDRPIADFVAYRLDIDMPPVTSTVLLRYDLPERPVP